MMDKEFSPKELLEIDWVVPLEVSDEFVSEEYLIKHSSAYKILNDAFTKVWSSDSEDELNRKQKNSLKKTKPKKTNKRQWEGRKNKMPYKSFNAYAKSSQINATQQEVFLNLMKKFNNNHSPFLSAQEQQDLQTYRILQEKVNKEQVEYLQFLKDYAFANQSRYLSINHGIRKCINELWKSHLQNPLRYPQFYDVYRTIALVLGDSKNRFEMISDEAVLQLGIVDRLRLRKHPAAIDTDYSTFIAKHPIIGNESQTFLNNLKYPVSQDKNAEHIARHTNADFVISSSGLKRICDNHSPLFQKSWELPITVKEYETKENGHTIMKRIIFIDKAFPKKKMTVVDKINWFHKIGIKNLLVSPNHLNCFRFDKHNKKREPLPVVDFLSGEDKHESFGTETSLCLDGMDVRCRGSRTEVRKTMGDKTTVDSFTKSSVSCMLENSKAVSSSDLSDSDDDHLMIEDEESNFEAKGISDHSKATAVCMKASCSTEVSKISNETGEEKKKPVTRSMAKMLENLNKVEEIVSKKKPNFVENLKIQNLRIVHTRESEVASSQDMCVQSEKEKDKVDDKINEKNKRQASISPEKNHQGSGEPKQSILDELLQQQSKMLGSDQKNKNAGIHNSKGNKKPINSSILVGYDPVPPPDGSNLIYRLFTLRKKDPLVDEFKILVRCKFDGMEYTKGAARMATIVPKVEFQPEFGAEAVTISELTRQWVSMLIRPKSSLIRARINAFTSEIVMIEQKEVRDFSREERFHNIQASVCLNTLNAVFRGISDLPPGQYILNHNSKMGAFANLYCATHEKRDSSYDLHKQYDVDSTSEEPQNISNLWIPIDFSIITPFHESSKRVPGTFNPENNKSGKGRRPCKKKSKKKT